MDMSKVMQKEMIFEKGNLIHYQTLEYVGIPFKCIQSHKYGHVEMECTHKFTKNAWVRKAKEMPLQESTSQEMSEGGEGSFMREKE